MKIIGIKLMAMWNCEIDDFNKCDMRQKAPNPFIIHLFSDQLWFISFHFSIQTPCCGRFYNCRYCHDENEDHHFDRKTLTELICTNCDTRQKVQADCQKCGVRFGKVRHTHTLFERIPTEIGRLSVCVNLKYDSQMNPQTHRIDTYLSYSFWLFFSHPEFDVHSTRV